MKLEDCPVGVYVPKAYDGKKPSGLVVSMTNAKSSSRYPRDFAPTLDRHDLIWVGFDPYNGLDTGGNLTFYLAIVYNMLGYSNIDRSRIYIGGFSLGGQMTETVFKSYPWVFSGAFFIKIGNSLGSPHRPETYFVERRTPIVYVEGDCDYNLRGAYEDYDTLVSSGYPAVHYFHEPTKGHIRISAEGFERTLGPLD